MPEPGLSPSCSSAAPGALSTPVISRRPARRGRPGYSAGQGSAHSHLDRRQRRGWGSGRGQVPEPPVAAVSARTRATALQGCGRCPFKKLVLLQNGFSLNSSDWPHVLSLNPQGQVRRPGVVPGLPLRAGGPRRHASGSQSRRRVRGSAGLEAPGGLQFVGLPRPQPRGGGHADTGPSLAPPRRLIYKWPGPAWGR